MAVINTNISAMRAQNGSRTADSALQTAMERLSTGKRINSAKDDAAGLAIASRMTSQVNGLSVAIRNANDGISMAQTAEGALGEVGNMLQRMRELAVQASNGTNSTTDRQTLQDEMTSLTSEIDSTSKATTYNGINLLDGSAGNVTLQVGSRAGDTLSFGIAKMDTKSLGLQGYTVQGQLTTGRVAGTLSLTSGDVLINGKDATGTLSASSNTAAALATAINSNTGQTNVSATAYNTVKGVQPSATSFAAGDIKINGTAIGAASSVSELVDNINRDASGVTASLADDGTITLSNNTGNDITIGGSGTTPASLAKAGFTGTTAGQVYSGYVAINSTTSGAPISVQAATGGAVSKVQQLGLNATADDSSFSGVSVSGTAFLATDDVKINNVSVGASNDASAASKAAAVNAISNQTNVTATAKTSATVKIDLSKATDGKQISINGVAVTIKASSGGLVSMADVVGNINGASSNANNATAGNSGVPGVVASADSNGNLVLTSTSGLDISVADINTQGFATSIQSDDGSTATAVAASASGTATTASAASTVHGRITLSSNDGSAVNVQGANVSKLGLATQGGTSDTIGGGLSILSTANATVAMKAIDSAIDKVSSQRGALGAVQNRLDTRVNVLTSSETNMSAARSRIEDTDFSSETTNLAKQQILSQAASAMLAQANQSGQSVLSLLRG